VPSYALVDVYIFAYNHEDFIARALEGVLMQDTSFPFHITILEDHSTDGTRDIVRRFAEGHPDLIDLELHERNLNSNRPFVDALSRSRARYVAVLDGDDYWTSPHKLRRQVDFLESHPDCALCFHRVEIVDQEGTRNGLSPRHPSTFSTIGDLFASNFLYTCSVLYRRSALEDIPEWFHEIRAADRNLHLLAARSGRIGYLDEVMAAWRRHLGGLWSGLGPVEQGLWAVQSQTQLLAHFDSFHPDIRKGLVNRYGELAQAQAAEGDLEGLAQSLQELGRLAEAPLRTLQQAIEERDELRERAAMLARRIEVLERRLQQAKAGEAWPSLQVADLVRPLSQAVRRLKGATRRLVGH
jgi:glycosyltransferase involved in cell wall biosynthesis